MCHLVFDLDSKRRVVCFIWIFWVSPLWLHSWHVVIQIMFTAQCSSWKYVVNLNFKIFCHHLQCYCLPHFLLFLLCCTELILAKGSKDVNIIALVMVPWLNYALPSSSVSCPEVRCPGEWGPGPWWPWERLVLSVWEASDMVRGAVSALFFPLSPWRLLAHSLSLSMLSTTLPLLPCQSVPPIVLLPSILVGSRILPGVWFLDISAPGSEASAAQAGDGSQPSDGQLGGFPSWPMQGVCDHPMEEVGSREAGRGWGTATSAAPGILAALAAAGWLCCRCGCSFSCFWGWGGGVATLLAARAPATGPTPVAAIAAAATRLAAAMASLVPGVWWASAHCSLLELLPLARPPSPPPEPVCGRSGDLLLTPALEDHHIQQHLDVFHHDSS